MPMHNDTAAVLVIPQAELEDAGEYVVEVTHDGATFRSAGHIVTFRQSRRSSLASTPGDSKGDTTAPAVLAPTVQEPGEPAVPVSGFEFDSGFALALNAAANMDAQTVGLVISAFSDEPESGNPESEL